MKWRRFVAIGVLILGNFTQFAQPAVAETVANTVISAKINGAVFSFEISHPETANCTIYTSPANNNCQIPISYRVTSQNSNNMFYGNGIVLNESNVKVGFFGFTTFLDSPSPNWQSSLIYASIANSGKISLFFTGTNDYTYQVISQKPITLNVSTTAPVPKITMDFSWNDNQSSELSRTFYEDQFNGDLRFFSIDAVTQSDVFYLKKVSLERNVNGSWKYMTANYFFYNKPEPGLKANFYGIDPFCGVRIWCSGKYRYRFIFGETVLKEFTVNFVPKKSNIKVKLTSDKEQAWGTVHTLKATITPKVSLTCTVERDNENIGLLKVKNGAGSMKFTALAREKPVSGRSVVSLYTVCNSGKYYGASEFSFALFVP